MPKHKAELGSAGLSAAKVHLLKSLAKGVLSDAEADRVLAALRVLHAAFEREAGTISDAEFEAVYAASAAAWEGASGAEDSLDDDAVSRRGLLRDAAAVIPKGAFGHRGFAAWYPENTVPGFLAAKAAGAVAIEMDIRVTSDGVAVGMHDATLERTTNGKGKVSAVTWDYIQTLDAGYTFTNDSGATYPFRGQGIKVPRLSDYFGAVGADIFKFNDIKVPEAVAPVLAAVEEYGAEETTLAATINILHGGKMVKQIQAACPTCACYPSPVGQLGFALASFVGAGKYLNPSCKVLGLPYISFLPNAKIVSQADAAGLKTGFWTVNDKPTMDKILAMGAEYITSDEVVMAVSAF